jgi:hypothetical protein
MDLPNLDVFSWYLIVLLLFSAISFLVFGLSCLFAPYMVEEFKRYGLKNFRILNGYLQIGGALGLLLGFYFRTIGLFASAGLAILMVMGFMIRLKIRDGFVKSFPAFFYAALNLTIYFLLLKTKF